MLIVFYSDSFEVGLASGSAPNEGKVEVKYDDTWSGVCYESKSGDTRSWSFANVQVACRELGFPGAMLARKGGQEINMRHSKIYGYKCTEGNHQPNTLILSLQKPSTSKFVRLDRENPLRYFNREIKRCRKYIVYGLC